MLQGKTVVFGQKSDPVPLCPPQILYGITRERTRVCAVRVWRLRPEPWHGREECD
jgi:hypothetical protein